MSDYQFVRMNRLMDRQELLITYGNNLKSKELKELYYLQNIWNEENRVVSLNVVSN